MVHLENDPCRETMNREYIDAAISKACYETLSDDGSFFGRIPGFQGVWANADTLEECKKELEDVLEDWLLFSISRNLAVPVVPGVDFYFRVDDG